jgi:3-hydroxyacyl-CoA dehydrogenase/enoyl-CoA hydratase/3-hydroxybutyryl-CoA epimerase
MNPPVTASLDSDGLGWIVFDDSANGANVLNPATFAALRQALAELAAQPVKAVIVISAKERIFIAGADLNWLEQLPDAASATQAAREGQALLAEIENFKAPVVCAIHGACAGGGFELALACHWRVATDARETAIGLTEIALGHIPGWGGGARLARLVGVKAATEHLLRASLVSALAAQEAGLIDEVVRAVELKERAKAAALRLVAAGRPVRPAPPPPEEGFFAAQRQTISARFRGQPAPLALLDALEQGAKLPLVQALEIEARLFGQIATGEVAHNMMHVFALKNAAKKRSLDAWFPGTTASRSPRLQRIGIVGAGVMGSGITQCCARQGLGAILNDANVDALRHSVDIVRKLFADEERHGRMTREEAHKAMGSIGITTDLRDFEDCDIVIEAIVEDAVAKRKLFAELARVVPPDCLLVSNTSALPIEELMADATNPGRSLGLHFFNPAGRMPLVEVVLGAQTTRETAERALGLVRALGKTPVVVKSAPGFFTTRVLFFYLHEACRLWEQGVPTGVLDGAMREWGWPMGPMRLIDEVGVDVTELIFGEMRRYFPGRGVSANICARMLAAGLKGRKNGASSGFYTYDGPQEEPNPAMMQFAPQSMAAVAMTPPAIQERLLNVLVAETERTLAEGVVKSADDADLALLLGAGFPAFRGGLMRWARAARKPSPGDA